MWDYEPESSDDLRLRQGDIVIVTERSNADWWIGECKGDKGVFPASYVEKINHGTIGPSTTDQLVSGDIDVYKVMDLGPYVISAPLISPVFDSKLFKKQLETSMEDVTLRTGSVHLHFKKWLTVSTSIGEGGGTVSSPETDCFVEVPSHALSASVDVVLEQHCIKSSVSADNGQIFLDVVHVSFAGLHLLKPADVFIRHHLYLSESNSKKICVYYCKNAAAKLPWTLIASLSHLGETVIGTNDMKIQLRKDFVQISATRFCEFCLSVQGRVEIVAQVFIMRMPNCLQLEVFLTCNCDQAVKRAESEMTAERFTKKKVVPLFVDTEKRSDLTMRVSSLRCGRAGGWTTRRGEEEEEEKEAEDRLVIPFQIIEKLLRNRAYPERRSFFCDKNSIESGCDVNSLQVQLCFEGGGMPANRKEWITAWELPTPPISPRATPSLPGNQLISQLTTVRCILCLFSGAPLPEGVRIRDAFSVISHIGAEKYLALGRRLLGCCTSQIIDIVSRLPDYSSFSDRLYIILEEWEKRMGEYATVEELLDHCRHPDVNIAGIVERDIRRIYLPPSQ